MSRAALASALFALAPLGAARQGVGWDGFPAFVWRLEYGERECPGALVAPFGGVNVEGDERADWVLERGLDFYVGHAPGREELYLERDRAWYDALWKRYYDERDASVLVREPCLSEPATLARLAARLEKSMEARGGANGLFVSLGDEVGLTPWGDPLDLCASEACRAGWKEFLRGELARLGLEIDPGAVPYCSTDDARRAWTAGDPSLLGPWMARRRHHQAVVLRALQSLADRARELFPATPVGLMGLSGRTAFGGVAVEEALRFLDVLEPYRTSDARELAYTLRSADQRVLRTIFFDEGSTNGAAWQAWEHFLRGGDGVVVWCDADLEQKAGYHERLGRAVSEIRAVRARVGAFRPEPRGVALLHSPDSLALAWLHDALQDGPTWPRRFAGYHEEHGTREVALRAWLRLCEDAGYLPGSVPVASVGARTVERFPLLVASHAWVLGPEDEARLVAYMEAGGQLVVEGPFAEFDAWGRPRERLGDRFEGAAHEHLRRAPESIARNLAKYGELRVAEDSAKARELAHWLREQATEAGARPLDWTITSKDWPRGWLVAEAPSAKDGERVCAAIPNVGEREDQADARGFLRDLELELAVDGASLVEWIHPRPREDGSAVLPAGDAAVFVLKAR